MAAPALPSPQQATTSSATSQKAMSSPTANVTGKAPAKNTTAEPLTYLSVKHSPAYSVAKSYLASGELERCLELIEQEIESTRMALQKANELCNEQPNEENGNEGNNEEEDTSDELHEAMAPLFYLNGTTLLYLVEENEEMVPGSKAASDPNGAEEPQPDQCHDQPNTSQNQEEEQEEVADPATDLEIAWENLDIARTILSRLVESFDPTSIDSTAISLKSDASRDTVKYTTEQQNELLLDLAQIHTRLGDVQRANDNTAAVEDYSRSLEIRRHVLGEFDKLVADNHYWLAQAYAEAPAKEKEREDGALGVVAALRGDANCSDSVSGGMSKEEIALCLEKSLNHYLACGVSFAGYLAKMCGVDAKEVTTVENESVDAASGSGGSNHSQTLRIIIQRIANLKPVDDADVEKFNETRELLDEIQEALDTAEGSEEALKTVHEMKENEIRKHAGKGGEEVVDDSGATTTIGFGGVESNATEATAVVAPTMMVVKKKKKPASSDNGGGAAKRAKSE